MRLPLLLLAISLLGCPPAGNSGGDDDDSAPSDRLLTMETSLGSFDIELYVDDAPITTENFLAYVDSGFFDGGDDQGATIFHRVVPDFVIQGGGQTADGVQKDTLDPIENEAADTGLSNERGTLSMARTNDPDSATSQFFVNLVDNDFLDAGGSTVAGYAVFGEVTDGMDVVDAIAGVALAGEQPVEDVVILSVERQ